MSTRRGPRPLQLRVRRLLVLLPWLMERGEASLAEMAERFQVTEKELVADLEQAAMCGLPPFLDEVVDLYIDDDGVAHVGIPRLFTKPLRLTAPEGFSLLMASRTAMELPGADPHGPLARALAKLEQVLGDDAIVVDLAQPEATADLIAAADDCAVVSIEYWAAARDEVSRREITPRTVFADRGRWYVVADDRRSGEQRTFRIDRITAWERTGELDARREVEVPDGSWFDDQPDQQVVRLRLPPAGHWVVERFPVRSVDESSGATVVELAVVSERWLRQVLLQLGPEAEVLDPPEWVDLGGRAARELLAGRYAATS